MIGLVIYASIWIPITTAIVVLAWRNHRRADAATTAEAAQGIAEFEEVLRPEADR